MERVVITIRPAPSEQGLLRVSDAMQQVIDLLKLHEEAQRAIASPEESFDWRLERASTNSPFVIVAVAEPRDPTANAGLIDAHARRVKREVSSGIRYLVERNAPAWWMGPDAIGAARDMFARTQNGIGVTVVDFGDQDMLTISRTDADAGLRAITGITAISVEAEIPERQSWGEIRGIMVAAGRYRGKPAIQIKTDQYGFVWCRLSPQLTERFGGEHRLTEVWAGKTLGVEGDLIYATGGKLSRIEAADIREIGPAAPIDLASVQDPGFTAGLDPVEYLRQLWEGSLAP